MSDFEFWGIYIGGLLVLMVPLAICTWVLVWCAKRLGKDVINFIRDAWEEEE